MDENDDATNGHPDDANRVFNGHSEQVPPDEVGGYSVRDSNYVRKNLRCRLHGEVTYAESVGE